MQGKIIRITNQLVVVKTATGEIIKCNMRGRFKREKVSFLVGDNVEFEKEENDEYGIVENILERKNSLIRPPVANIDQVIVVFAVTNPEINQEILDTFLAVMEYEELDVTLCFNKSDLDIEKAKELKEKYSRVGYEVILSSTINDNGIDEIRKALKGKVTAFAGPSGVGKSSILNMIFEKNAFEIGDISERTLKGRHTTKAVELIELDFGGSVFDTPGFTTISLLKIEKENLEYTFKEFRPYLGQCKFSECRHMKEPDCKIKHMVKEGVILQDRYDMYVDFYNKLKEKDTVREKSNKNYKGKKVFISSREYNKKMQ